MKAFFLRSAMSKRSLLFFTAVAALASPRRVVAQDPAVRGSRFVNTDSWMVDAIARLRARGLLASLNPLTQPWERKDVQRAVAAIPLASLDTMPRHVADWIRLLRSEFVTEGTPAGQMADVTLGYSVHAGAVGATSPRIDPHFPLRRGVAPRNGQARDGRSVWPLGGAGVWAERGPFALELRLGWNLALRRGDPDGRFPGRIFDVLPDNEVSYLNARFSDGGFVVGRLRRNWAPIGTHGLMVSDHAIGMPQIGYDIGGRLSIRGFVAELDTLQERNRFFAAHRIEYYQDDFAISIGESKVYGSTTGFGLTNLNPIEIFFITGDHLHGESPTNTGLDGQFWIRRGQLTLLGETFIDDLWVMSHAPPRMAINAGIGLAGPRPWIELGLGFRAVHSFTYWTPEEGHQNSDQMTYYGRGLGDNQSDYDRWTLHANVYPSVRGLRLTPTLSRQRKGEWDFRNPPIPGEEWRARRAFLQGIPERTTRASIAGRYQTRPEVFADWDVGINRVNNANHEGGRLLTEMSAMVRVGLLVGLPDHRVR